MERLLGAWLVFLGSAAPVFAEISFTDVTLEAGVNYRHFGPRLAQNCVIQGGFGVYCEYERFTGGAAAGDFDGDGWDDLIVSRLEAPPILFRNNGDGTFSDVTASAGLDQHVLGNGLSWFDADNDGDLDLLMLTIWSPRFLLYMNDGTGRFTEEGDARGISLPGIHMGFSAAIGDYDNDGWLDFYTSEWNVAFFLEEGQRHHCRLWRNRGAAAPGHFEDRTDAAGVDIGDGSLGWGRYIHSFGPHFTDLDRDGWLDLAIAADFKKSRLYWNNGNGTFTNGTRAANVGTDENGMGSTFGDFDGDGDLDWFVTSIWDPLDQCSNGSCGWRASGNRLYRNEGNRVFSDATDAAGVRYGWWGWGAAFFDANNNGRLDLVMTNGFEVPGLEDRAYYFFNDPMVFWKNNGAGAFVEASASAGILDTRSGKGLLVFDYDQDGDLDVFVVNNHSYPVLYRNDTVTDNGWLRVRFTGAKRAFEGLNAWVTVTAVEEGPAQVREMGTSTHFLGQSERGAHFGLGPGVETVHELRVEWPRTGTVQVFHGVAVNQEFVITAPEAEVVEPPYHSADCRPRDWRISLSELLRVIQFYNAGGYREDAAGEDGYVPDSAATGGARPHSSDYAPQDGRISLPELLRCVQFFNRGGYRIAPGTEDGYAPGK